VVVDKRALRQVQDALERQLWARGSRDEVVRGAERGGLRLSGRVLSAREVLDVSSFLAVSWTFGFLQAFGVLTGLITLAGLLLYVQTRQRSRQVVYVLTKRMGLSRAAHRDSVLVEVGLPLAAGFAAGAALSLLAARLVYPHLDALPTIPPVPLLRVPTVVIAGAAAVVLMAVWLAAQTAQRSADRVSAAEVLRLAP
jgi:putative ABC transport system permease protein